MGHGGPSGTALTARANSDERGDDRNHAKQAKHAMRMEEGGGGFWGDLDLGWQTSVCFRHV